MPLTPRFEWSETEGGLAIRVHVPGAVKLRPDVFATSAMVKVNSTGSTPYLLVLDLFGEVDDTQSAATLDADGVTFKLVKVRGRIGTDGDAGGTGGARGHCCGRAAPAGARWRTSAS
jgi:hypothetical protein